MQKQIKKPKMKTEKENAYLEEMAYLPKKEISERLKKSCKTQHELVHCLKKIEKKRKDFNNSSNTIKLD